MGYDVFISYAHEDKAIAKRITEALDANGIHYFIDWNNINGGEQYIEAIALALRNSSIVLFIGSQSAYESPYVYREIKFAQEKNPGHIIPLLIDNSPMPDRYEFILGDANFRYL